MPNYESNSQTYTIGKIGEYVNDWHVDPCAMIPLKIKSLSPARLVVPLVRKEHMASVVFNTKCK